MVWVHVRLDLEHDPRHRRFVGFDHTRCSFLRARRRRKADKRVENLPDTEVLKRRAEVHGRQRAVAKGCEIEPAARALHEIDVLAPAGGGLFTHELSDGGIIGARKISQILRLGIHLIDARAIEIIRAFEGASRPHGPDHRRGVERQDVRNFVQQFDRLARFAVHFIDKRHDRDVAQTANLKQLSRARFDALGRVDDHDRAIDRGQRAIGLIGEVFVARRIEQVHHRAAVFEGHDRRHNRNTARTLDRHPVGARVLLVALGFDLSRELDRAAEQQELFGQRRFASVGVRDDRERAPARDLALHDALRRAAQTCGDLRGCGLWRNGTLCGRRVLGGIGIFGQITNLEL